jgi:hypothetical protein
MWIEINKSCFESSDFKVLNHLYQILSWYPTASIPRYNVFVDINAVENTQNYKKLSTIELQLNAVLEQDFNTFVNTKPARTPKDYIITAQSSTTTFDIEEAIRFFNQPVAIVLENNKNDAYFIKAIIKYFDNNQNKAREHLKNGWISFQNAGGCSNVQNFMEEYWSVFDDLAARHGKFPTDYFRGLVILDSDKAYPTETQKQQYTKLIDEFLHPKNIKYHILEKRMMENYMPDEVFEDIKTTHPDLQTWIDAYLHLTSEQKDFLHFKDGIWKTTPIPPSIAALYNISAANFTVLNAGFKYPKIKTKFAELFETSPYVHKTSLTTRANSDELQRILNKIISIL